MTFDYCLKLIPVDSAQQVRPATFEFAPCHRVDNEPDRFTLRARYSDDASGVPTFDPAVPPACSRGVVSSRSIAAGSRNDVPFVTVPDDNAPTSGPGKDATRQRVAGSRISCGRHTLVHAADRRRCARGEGTDPCSVQRLDAEQGEHQQYRDNGGEQKEQDFRDACSACSDAGETEQTGNDRNKCEDDGPFQHGGLLEVAPRQSRGAMTSSWPVPRRSAIDRRM